LRRGEDMPEGRCDGKHGKRRAAPAAWRPDRDSN